MRQNCATMLEAGTGSHSGRRRGTKRGHTGFSVWVKVWLLGANSCENSLLQRIFLHFFCTSLWFVENCTVKKKIYLNLPMHSLRIRLCSFLSCCSKLRWALWFQTTELYSLSFGGQEVQHQDHQADAEQDTLVLDVLEENYFVSCRLWGYWHSLALQPPPSNLSVCDHIAFLPLLF